MSSRQVHLPQPLWHHPLGPRPRRGLPPVYHTVLGPHLPQGPHQLQPHPSTCHHLCQSWLTPFLPSLLLWIPWVILCRLTKIPLRTISPCLAYLLWGSPHPSYCIQFFGWTFGYLNRSSPFYWWRTFHHRKTSTYRRPLMYSTLSLLLCTYPLYPCQTPFLHYTPRRQ